MGQECKELIDRAIALEESAMTGFRLMDLTNSTSAFYQAADLYEEININPGCAGVELSFSPLTKADNCREMAAESKALELFTEAKKLYSKGEEFESKRQWTDAEQSFVQAASIWEYAADLTIYPQNRQRALQSSKQARDRAANAANFHE